MLLCDVVFPQNIPPLTYRVPETLKDSLSVGQTVLAPLRGKPKKALLWQIYKAEPVRQLDEILSIQKDIPPLSKPLLKLFNWACQYYLCNEGQVLRASQFEYYGSRPRRAKPPKIKAICPDFLVLSGTLVPPQKGVVFYRSGSFLEEMSIASKLIFQVTRNRGGAVLVMCPERHEVEELYLLLKEVIPEELLGFYHGMLTDAQKSTVINRLLTGQIKILVGTKSAVFLPVKNLSLIIVLREHSRQYKQQEVPKLNARDIAVKRAQIESIPVVLTSQTPSVETFLNVMIKKYTLKEGMSLKPNIPVVVAKKGRTHISPALTFEIKDFLRQKGAVLVLEQKLGYGILHCPECDHTVNCPRCNRPLTFHKKKGLSLLCHFCPSKMDPPGACPVCGSFSLEVVGHGIEKTEELLKETFQEVRVIQEESPVIEPASLYLGTLKSYRILPKAKVLLAILNPDMLLNIPELRPAERMFQDLCYLAGQLPHGSRVVLQTLRPSEDFYRFLRRWDYMGFLKKELYLRKTMTLPPFKKVISLTVHLRSENDATGAEDLVRGHLKGLTLQGPIVTGSTLKGFKIMLKFLLKGSSSTTIRQRLKDLEGALMGLRATLRVDVDPYEI